MTELTLSTNQAAVLYGIVSAITGLAFLLCVIFTIKLKLQKRALVLKQKVYIGFACCILIATLELIKIYLELRNDDILYIAVFLPFWTIFFIETVRFILDLITPFDFWSQKMPYGSLTLILIGIVYIFDGITMMFI
ncbi:hypothetical protein SHI21_16210 [Bacteriovorax sp. PP10]|uniref:Uncharacterized protein n=1 Tax=Bacteriovorax antarcticus TaxID=3088717 RepID=A0ABU5VXJ0_9BACT|nr:hypothetical protein [Bacteriovorax sp. PP10]MEA9357776.1 hypothetical protein [Bacteriovorax sp. PP10]